MSANPLFGEALRSAAAPWLEELGKSDRERLEALLGLAVGERIRMSDCLAALFPGVETQKAQSALTSVIKRLNEAAEGEGRADLGLRFHMDSNEQNPPTERVCWFTGPGLTVSQPDPAVTQAERYFDQVTANIEGKSFVSPQGIATTGNAMASKRVVRFFVSYAHTDKTLFRALERDLLPHFASSARYELYLWTDRDLLAGEHWKERLGKAIENCEFGLLMISPAFLASKPIGEFELPHFVGTQDNPKLKPSIPVGLVPVSAGSHDLKGLDERHFFLFQNDEIIEGRYYDQMPDDASKRAFVHQLYLAIEKRLDAFFAAPPGPPPILSGPDARISDTLANHVPFPDKTHHYQRNKGLPIALGDQKRRDTGGLDLVAPPQASDALGELESWATNPAAPPFFALLGEYGIGKTTTLKQFTRHLLEERKTRPELPLPIYVDLRDYVGETRDSVPTIEQLLSSVMERRWKLRDHSITPQNVLRLVREEGALILFDGLDEKIVHLRPDRARDFIRTLWAVLPDAAGSSDSPPTGKRRGKFLISCRSEYFRNVGNQDSMLMGGEHEGPDHNPFPALCLLPFTEEQIRDYLTSFLGTPERGVQAFDVIASIHDLRDLAERPYLLSLISGRLGELEQLKARGKKVNAARLYELVVNSWLDRDTGKHQLAHLHKRRIMEELAAALWRGGTGEWDVDRLEEWLDGYLIARPVGENKDHTVLKEDLRTATFVVRPPTEEKHFRFAHTSLQEYFLAAYLARALREERLERWDLPRVSRETLEFLGQLLDLEPQQPVALRSLEAILGGENIRAAVLAFDYWLRALAQDLPVPTPKRVKLAGADLEEWHLRGRGPAQPLNLRGADLSGSRLNRARVEHVDLADADLTAMEARQALFLKVNAPRARAQGADFRGLRWREGSLLGAELRGAQLTASQWIQVGLAGALLPEGWERYASTVEEGPGSPFPRTGTPSLTLNLGHTSFVTACAWSPDGRRFLSGSWDNSLRVWDASTGDRLLTLSGHASLVTACAWSPDGLRLLSGSDDRSLRVWDAVSGDCLLTLSGHTARVTACAWSPDGLRLLSGSSDNTLRVWDAASGDCLLTLSGHTDTVTACTWSPDGSRLLSGSRDKSLRVWDAASSDCLLTLSDHAFQVTACAWSPDGRRLLSGSSDAPLRVWDAASGDCLLILSSHDSSATACAWSPDGQRLLSGSWDNSLRVWDAASGDCLLALSGHAFKVTACAWSPDGQRLLSGSDDKSLRVWDASSGACLLALSGHTSFVTACAWSPDGLRLVSGAYDRYLRVWNASSGGCLLALSGHASFVTACAWSPDGQHLLSGASDNTLRVWDAASGTCLRTLSGHTSRVTACVWSPDGQRLLSGSDDESLRIWAASSGACLRTLSGHASRVKACAWSPDGQRLLSGSDDKSLRVWDASSGACLLILSEHASTVTACAWSPDGLRLLSGSSDTNLRVWDAASGNCLRTLSGHASTVTACAWSPDGLRLLSGSWDNSLRVWDASSGQCVWSGHHFPEGQIASLDEVHGRVLHASPEAWRWLGWRWTDPATGRLRILPAEAFGPLPA